MGFRREDRDDMWDWICGTYGGAKCPAIQGGGWKLSLEQSKNENIFHYHKMKGVQ